MRWKRQLRTTVLLLLLIAGCAGAGLYFRAKNAETQQVTTETGPVMQEVTDALARFENRGAGDIATLRQITEDEVPQKAELAILGLADEATMRALLAALNQNGLTATFYISGNDATTSADSLALVANAGYTIGVANAETDSTVDNASAKRAVSSFIRTSAAIQTVAGIWPAEMLTLQTPNNTLLAAAYATYMTTVTVPTKTVTLADIATPELAQALVASLPRASMLCIQLSRAYTVAPPGLSALCEALAATNLGTQAQAMVAQNKPAAEPVKRVYTTERAVAFTFSGFGNDAELQGALKALTSVNGTATFFVTREEVTRYPDELSSVLKAGNQLGISVQASRYGTVEALLEEILKTQEAIQTQLAYDGELPVRPAYGNATDLLMQACGAGGFTLLGAMVNAVRTEDIRATDAVAVANALLPEASGVLQRGEIVHFQMKQYQRDDQMLGSMVRQIATARNIYSLKPVLDMLSNTEEVYTYPLPEDQILTAVKGKIFPGQLNGSAITAIAKRYIGIDWVANAGFLPGFSTAEVKRLNKTGLVPNKYNRVFLTFDDWGTDQTITALLDVLRAHKAKATFFVRTQNVVYNPNLLRAIAVEGHTIGCHTHTHFPLSNDTGNGKKFTELTDSEVEQLKLDLVKSYDTLESIVGDVSVGGQPALSLLFRPPTLAVGKNGLTAVFDCGFTYSVSGTYTTQDYKATDAAKLAAELKKYTESGAILIMHMSDTSVYTAAALDLYLSEMELKYADKPYQFVGLASSLQ